MKKTALFFLTLSLANSIVHAETAQLGAATLRRPLGARATSMGGAFAGAAGGIDSLGYNPAGLYAAEFPILQTAYTHGIVSAELGCLGMNY